MNIVLTDDGTLDTVLRCTECGEEFRFNYQSDDTAEDGESYDEYVQDRIDEIEAEHECPSECCSHSYCTERTCDASGLCAGHRREPDAELPLAARKMWS